MYNTLAFIESPVQIMVVLIIALIGAFLLYVALYIFYEAAGANLDTAPAVLVTLRNLVFRAPDSLALALLKWGLILFAFYIVADALIATLRHSGKGKDGRNKPRGGR